MARFRESSRKTPTRARSLFWGALVLCAAGIARAEPLTEARVIRLARTETPAVLAARAQTRVAQTDEVRAGLYPNPSLGWDREKSPGPEGSREDSIFLSVPIEFSGRRPAEKALARASSSLERARAARTESDAVIAALGAFYEALRADREAEIGTHTLERLDEATRVVRRRHEEGTTSGYEVTRLELEAELARSRLREAETTARAARATLAVLLGIDATDLELAGDWTTLDPTTTGSPPNERRSIEWLRQAGRHARDARDASGWAFVPELSVSGGVRFSELTSTPYGYVAGVTLSLPVFSSGQELRELSSARQELALLETQAARRDARSVEVRAREELVAARREIERLGTSTRERLALLEASARSGYREGQRSVVELLDAERTRADIERRRLELEVLAKHAEIALRAARGEFER